MFSFARIYSAQPHYLKGTIVTVEVDISPGINSFTIVGLPSKAVDEARDRVGSALKNTGFPSPKNRNHRTVVSLAPADLRKEGSYFDLAIAIGYLRACNIIVDDLEQSLFIGELALNGDVLPVRGILPITQSARDAQLKYIFVPYANAKEAGLIEGIMVYPVKHLKEVVDHVRSHTKRKKHSQISPQPQTLIDVQDYYHPVVDFADVRGQEQAKRALEISASGGHNIAMFGPPGTGKTMLAKAFISLLPALDRESALEVTGIHSIAGTLQDTMITLPPFRSPHHTASYVSIIGGSSRPRPGEVTLAHKGVLFMDEFPEFDKHVLESLRQPLEDRVVHISRANGTATFPTDFILVSAMNPPSPDATAYETAQYKKKISGPIMDRIDMWFPVEHIDYEKLSMVNTGNETTIKVRERVMLAREIQKRRFSLMSCSAMVNARMSVKEIEKLVILDSARSILNMSAKRLGLSPRSYHRVIKLSQTIADLDQSEKIKDHHVLEALQYRPREW